MEKCSSILYDKSLNGLALRHFDILMTSIFISMTLDGEMSFSRIKNLHVNASMAVKILGGICVHALAKIWKHLKDTLAFLSFIVSRIEIESCLQVICCQIYHWLSVDRRGIYNSRFALVVYQLRD